MKKRVPAMSPGLVFPTLAMLAVLTTTSMATMAVAVLAPEAAPDIGVDATRIGVFMAIVYVLATLSGAATGTLVSRYGAIRTCQATMLFAAVGMLALTRASVGWALASAVLLGLSQGPFNPASAHVLWRLSSPRWRPFVFSVKQTGVPLGGALAGALMPPLAVLFGWKAASLAVAAAALAMMALLQPLRAAFDAERDGAGPPLALARLIDPVRLALGDPTLRRLTLAAFAFAGSQLSVASFMVIYLTRTMAMDLVHAGSVFALLQIGGFAGRLVWGVVAARLGAPGGVLVGIGATTAALLVATAAMTPAWPAGAVLVLAALLGASSFGWNGIMLAEVATHAPRGLAADATAGMQVLMFGSIAVVPPAFGAIVGATGSFAAAFTAIAALAAAGTLLLARSPAVARPG